MPEQSPVRLTETAGTVIPSNDGASSGRYRVLLISEGVGSSGLYPRKTLQEAATKQLIGPGTPAYFDHPSATESMDRPERSVRDMGGVYTSFAEWSDEDKGLVADLQVFAPYRPLVAELAPHIGLSIRGGGVRENLNGQPTVTSLDSIESVDLVTKAGRGGKFLSLVESARQNLAEARNVGQHLESRLHQDFTNRADDMAANGQLTRDERIHLSNAVGKGLSAFAGHLEENAPQLYQRDIWDEPETAATRPVGEATTTVPGRSAAGSPTTTVKEGLVPELTEAEVTALRTTAAQAEAARDAALAEAATARAALAESTARAAARPAVAARVAESQTLSARTQGRLVESVVAGLPVVDGAIAAEALTAAVTAAVQAAEAEAAEYGRPALTEAWGSFSPAARTEIAEADAVASYDRDSARIFGRTVKGN